MAGNEQMNPKDLKASKKQIQEQQKKLKQEQKEQKKMAKAKAKELVKQQNELMEEGETSSISTALVTTIIVIVWLLILAVLIKLDVGRFGSTVLTPVLKDIPIVNMILPSESIIETNDGSAYMGYSSLKDAVEQIKQLGLELEKSQTLVSNYSEDIAALNAEIARLKTFEESQVEFQRIKTQFFDEVVYSDKGPGAEAYQKFYEAIDPTTAEFLYKQVIVEQEEDKEVAEYAKAYSEMKPKAAAGIFEEMKDNLSLAAKILGVMDSTSRGKILGAMDPEIAAKITKIMDPQS